MEPPIAERHLKEVIFGKEDGINKGNSRFLINPPLIKNDYYYWLRDDKRKNKKVLKYLDDENKYADEVLAKSGVYVEKNKILAELKKNMIEDYETLELPFGKFGFDSPYRFYKVFEKGKSYPIYYYKINNKKVKYLDPNDYKKSKMNDISNPVFSPSLNIFGYGVDTNGSEKYEIHLFKFPSMEKIEHNLPKILYADFILSDDSIFYLEEDDANRPCKLIFNNLIDKEKKVIYEEKNIEKQIQISMGDDYKCIIYSIENYNDNEVRIYWFDGERKGEDILVRKLKKGIEYYITIYKEYLIIRTNADNWKNYGIKYSKIGSKRWYNFIKYNSDVSTEDVTALKDGLLISCRSNGEQYLKYLKLNKMKIKEEKIIKKGDGGYCQEILYDNFNTNSIIICYQNFITPISYYEINLENMKEKFLKQKKTKNFDASKYKVKREYVQCKGIKVAVDMISLKDSKNDKCLLYGYNSYGSIVEIKFDEKLFPLVDKGFVYAVANTRGSSYYGKVGYEDGMMLKKMNTFFDFIKVSEFLINNNYCKKDGLSIEGRSAGGLLVGAVSVLRPDLYKNVLAGVPFVDVLTTMSDASIPLTTSEWSQWGNPNIRRYYNYMKKYSPIDNIKEGVCYPNYYIQAGLNDPRVAYWEPAKFIATLRYNSGKKCKSTFVLKTEMEKGHFGSFDRYKYLEEIAERYAFIIKNDL